MTLNGHSVKIIDFDHARVLTESYHLRSYKMKMGNQPTDATKAAALYMLKNGLASYKEIAELSGRSKQIIRIWGGKVDAPEARRRYLKRIWTRASRSRR